MKLFLLSLLLFVTSIVANDKLTQKLTDVINTLPKSTNASINILDATTGENIYSSNANKAMIPASNTKLFTTAAALNLMGPNFEIETKIFSDDLEITNGLIDGNLFIKGFGQSTFRTKHLDSLVNILYDSGIRKINGNIIADDSYFDKLYTRDDWIIDERANVKLPPVSALIINKNQFVITLNSTGKVGSKLKYSLKPECSFIDVDMNATVSNRRSRPRISASFKGEKLNVKVRGSLRKRRTSRSYVVNIDNPPLYFALLLKEKLQKKGIKIIGNAETGVTPESVNDLASIGIPLNELIALINKNSNNYLAECLFKTLGAFYSGEEGNSFYATQAVLSSFDEKFIIDDETAVVDGSGISRFNTITTGSIVRLLNHIRQNEFLYEEFYRSLAISGIDGTLKDRPVNSFIKGNFHGKTGTLNGVTALSGYLTGKNNHMYIVSIIMEYKAKGSGFHKEIEDKILVELSK